MQSAAKSLVALLVICTLSGVCKGSSVLTHEQIIDLVWEDQIKVLLLEKYPETSPENLRVAHGYAYGGSLIQDLGIIRSGTGSLVIWSITFAAVILCKLCWTNPLT